MIDTGTYLPLRLFDSRDEMTFNRRECDGYNHKMLFYYPQGYIPPFQIRYPWVTGSGKSGLQITLHGCENSYDINDVATVTDTVEHYQFVTCMGGLTGTSYPAGLYYLTYGTYHSDYFYVQDVSEMVEIKYRGKQGLLGDTYWKEGFFGRCWVDTVIDKPIYPITDEVKQDQEGDSHRVFQRWIKQYSIRFLGVESMADAMSLLPLMEEVYINNSRVYDTITDIDWDDDYECLCNINISCVKRKVLQTF